MKFMTGSPYEGHVDRILQVLHEKNACFQTYDLFLLCKKRYPALQSLSEFCTALDLLQRVHLVMLTHGTFYKLGFLAEDEMEEENGSE